MNAYKYLLIKKKSSGRINVLFKKWLPMRTYLKSKDITRHPIVMYRCENWTYGPKAECRKINAFKLWCWRRFLRVPWTGRRSNQSLLKEINPEYSLEVKYSLEGWMLKL